MCRTALAAFAFSIAAGAHAQCALNQTAVTGSVVDRDGKPVAAAVVEARWDERKTPGVTSRTTSDEAGMFNLPIHYNTYSGRGITGGEKCEFKLDAVDLTVKNAADGGASRRVRLDDEKLVSIEVR
jgi:hypothetical protein